MISIDRRITAAETLESAREERIKTLASLAATVPDIRHEVRTMISRLPYAIALNHPSIEMVVKHANTAMGNRPHRRGEVLGRYGFACSRWYPGSDIECSLIWSTLEDWMG